MVVFYYWLHPQPIGRVGRKGTALILKAARTLVHTWTQLQPDAARLLSELLPGTLTLMLLPGAGVFRRRSAQPGPSPHLSPNFSEAQGCSSTPVKTWPSTHLRCMLDTEVLSTFKCHGPFDRCRPFLRMMFLNTESKIQTMTKEGKYFQIQLLKCLGHTRL